MARRPPVYFAHMHKAAGTTVADIARWQGETVVENAFDGFSSASVSAQQRYLNHHNVTFLSLELLPNELPRDVLKVALLREPVDRSISHFAHTNFKLGVKPCPAYFPEWATTVLDNMMVRQLCGPQCAGAPVGGLRSEHFDLALYRLFAMDLIGVVDNWPNFVLRLAQLANWTHKVPLYATSRVTPDDRRWRLSVSRKEAREANLLDAELYARVEDIAAQPHGELRLDAEWRLKRHAKNQSRAHTLEPMRTAYVSPLWCDRLLPRHVLGRCDPAERFVNRTRTLCALP